MDLIKDLGSRSVTSSSGKTDTRKWGLFECPSCHSHIELKMYKGLRNKTCGSAGCRIVDRTSQRKSEEDKLKNLPYYSSFVDFYKRIKDASSTEFSTISKFREAMYDKYKEARDEFKKVTLYVSDSEPYNSSNIRWVSAEYEENYNFNLDIAAGKFHTLMLAEELSTPKANILRTMKKLKDFGEYTYEIIGCPGYLSRPYKAYFLSKEQYVRLKDAITTNIKKKSSNVYLMCCEGYHKIGITSNIAARLSALDGSTPFSVTLIHSKKVADAPRIEKELHIKYKEFNTKKEWFNLTDAQVKEITEYLDSL